MERLASSGVFPILGLTAYLTGSWPIRVLSPSRVHVNFCITVLDIYNKRACFFYVFTQNFEWSSSLEILSLTVFWKPEKLGKNTNILKPIKM